MGFFPGDYGALDNHSMAVTCIDVLLRPRHVLFGDRLTTCSAHQLSSPQPHGPTSTLHTDARADLCNSRGLPRLQCRGTWSLRMPTPQHSHKSTRLCTGTGSEMDCLSYVSYSMKCRRGGFRVSCTVLQGSLTSRCLEFELHHG